MLIVVSDELHKRLKKVANAAEKTLKKATEEAILEYVLKNEKKESLV